MKAEIKYMADAIEVYVLGEERQLVATFSTWAGHYALILAKEISIKNRLWWYVETTQYGTSNDGSKDVFFANITRIDEMWEERYG